MFDVFRTYWVIKNSICTEEVEKSLICKFSEQHWRSLIKFLKSFARVWTETRLLLHSDFWRGIACKRAFVRALVFVCSLDRVLGCSCTRVIVYSYTRVPECLRTLAPACWQTKNKVRLFTFELMLSDSPCQTLLFLIKCLFWGLEIIRTSGVRYEGVPVSPSSRNFCPTYMLFITRLKSNILRYPSSSIRTFWSFIVKITGSFQLYIEQKFPNRTNKVEQNSFFWMFRFSSWSSWPHAWSIKQ